jgi:His-Xaa-Ser system protein HxsD
VPGKEPAASNSAAPDPASVSTPVRIGFDSRVYGLETLQKAALKFTRIASFDFRVEEGQQINVIVTSVPSLELNAAQFTGLFRTEVLDQHLRAVVARETETERNLILAYAFSNTKLIAS